MAYKMAIGLNKWRTATTVEAWGRSENNPNGGWYGLKKDFVDGLECIFHHLWKNLDLQK